jgi:hypothetical protein
MWLAFAGEDRRSELAPLRTIRCVTKGPYIKTFGNR